MYEMVLDSFKNDLKMKTEISPEVECYELQLADIKQKVKLEKSINDEHMKQKKKLATSLKGQLSVIKGVRKELDRKSKTIAKLNARNKRIQDKFDKAKLDRINIKSKINRLQNQVKDFKQLLKKANDDNDMLKTVNVMLNNELEMHEIEKAERIYTPLFWRPNMKAFDCHKLEILPLK